MGSPDGLLVSWLAGYLVPIQHFLWKSSLDFAGKLQDNMNIL
jgi:hypothetical protein